MSFADVAVVSHPEAPGFVNPFLGVLDADPRTSGYATWRNALVLFKPNSLTQKICAVKLSIDPHRDAEFARAVREVVIRM